MLECSAHADGRAAARQIAQELLDQSRLADARFSRDQNQAAVAMGVKTLLRETRKLVRPSHEWPLNIAVNAHAKKIRTNASGFRSIVTKRTHAGADNLEAAFPGPSQDVRRECLSCLIMKCKAVLLAIVLAAAQFAPPTAVLAQSNARTGCLNQWLFNGVWRAKITKVEPLMNGAQQAGWQVTQVWRNGTSRELAPADSSLKDMSLHLSGTVLQAEEHRVQMLTFNTMAPSGELTYTQTFFAPNMSADPNDKPKALDVTFDNAVVSTSNKPHFTSRQYNFHYRLDCAASGAAAQAEGGSAQLAATNGCMNQWMSNGVWKMRVLGVVPNPPGAQAKDQNGWRVKQEWVNITHGKVYPGVLPDVGNRVAPTNVSDEFLATQSGNNASSFNAVGGFALGARNVPFNPGVPYSFEQLIAGGNLDPADAPTRLLVTFDTAAQSKVNLPIPVPRYRMPANFRISLTCGGTVTMAPGWDTLHTPAPSQPAAAQPASPAQQVASAQKPPSGLNPAVDPCTMLSAPDVASALGVGASSLGKAQRPSANQCAWAVASHSSAPARNVVLTVQAVQPPAACHGLSCLHIVQQITGMPGVPGVPAQFAEAFNDAQMIEGLGDKAAWKDGRLTVVKAGIAFQLLVQGSRSPALATSETLARAIIDNLPAH